MEHRFKLAFMGEGREKRYIVLEVDERTFSDDEKAEEAFRKCHDAFSQPLILMTGQDRGDRRFRGDAELCAQAQEKEYIPILSYRGQVA